jgi:2-dehydropantoate 2-reductase
VYLILGAGRLSRHMARYFGLIDIQFKTWSRKDGDLTRLLNSSPPNSKILFLVSDDQIEPLKNQYDFKGHTLIHCSGSKVIEDMFSAHPLFSFSAKELHSLEVYESIPFITEKNQPSLREIFPELKNRSFAIEPKLKPLYHAFCVASGNFTQILWAEVQGRMTQKLGLPSDVLGAYLDSVYWSLRRNSDTALTGPLARKDFGTIRSNLKALEGDELRDIYRAFLKLSDISESI